MSTALNPVGYMSPQQVPLITDQDGQGGRYIPMRKTPAGNFTLALYATPPDVQAVLRRCIEAMDEAGGYIPSTAWRTSQKLNSAIAEARSLFEVEARAQPRANPPIAPFEFKKPEDTEGGLP